MACWFSGTEAWIDASGYLRFKEYIANENGYNVIKSKTIFVGIDRPIQVCFEKILFLLSKSE